MSHLRLTASKMFAIEITKAVFAQKSLLVGISFNAPWMYVDMEMGDERTRLISLLIKIHDAPSRIRSDCEVYSRNGKWLFGTCSITLVDIDPDRVWSFNCELQDGKIVVTDET